MILTNLHLRGLARHSPNRHRSHPAHSLERLAILTLATAKMDASAASILTKTTRSAFTVVIPRGRHNLGKLLVVWHYAQRIAADTCACILVTFKFTIPEHAHVITATPTCIIDPAG